MAEGLQTIGEHFEFWKRIGGSNGWVPRALTVWVDRDTKRIVDSVGVRDGDGTVYVKDSETDEVTHEFKHLLDYLGWNGLGTAPKVRRV